MRKLGVALLALFALLNVLAAFHARSMLHFTRDGTRTQVPERLGALEKARVLLLGVNIPKPTSGRTPSDLTLVPMRIATSDSLALSGWWIPCERARATVILFHGYAGWKETMFDEARVFHDLGCECLLIDFRGSGGSDGYDTTVGYREADDVRAVIDCVPWRRPVLLFGQSMGGAAVLRALSIAGRGVDGAIVENVFDRMLNAIRNRFALMGMPSFPAAELLCFWGGVESGFNAFEHAPVDYARKVKVPVLDLQGEKDPRATLEQARSVFDALRGPKRFVVFPGTTHVDLLAADSTRWKDAVVSFLDERVDSAHASGDLRTPGGNP